MKTTLLYFFAWFLLQLFQLLAVSSIQHGKLEQHDYTDSKLIALVWIICYGIYDIKKSVRCTKGDL